MDTIKRLGAFSLALGAFASAQGASAAGIVGQVDVRAESGLNARVVQATSTVDGGLRTEAGPSNARSGESSGTEASTATTTPATDEGVAAGASVSAKSGTVVVTKGDVEGEEPSETLDPMEVSATADFEAYARSVVASDDNVLKIESGPEKVSVWYREPAKFIGIVPVTVSTRATVYAGGEIEIDRPWWAALFVTGENTEDIETDLTATAGAIARTEASAALSSNAQARLVNALRAVLEARHEASVEASTSTGARDASSVE
ncbi:MAG: hypothetical protein HZA81_02620 [Candidatus Taylorbacteria bacterium]|nr:hypothetical protein [Candidatus Taylorbacteria bacterium]